jgi:hypothetical protein
MPSHGYLALPRRGCSSDARPQLLEQFARAARAIPNVANVTIRKSTVVFDASPEALDQLRAQFGATFIIEPERYLDPSH